MSQSFLALPDRSAKPRKTGLTVLIDSGQPIGRFSDFIQSHAAMIDMVKFGWGTALVTPLLEKKLDVLIGAGIPFFFGGTGLLIVVGYFKWLHARSRHSSCFCFHADCAKSLTTHV